jgi:hypothetical protein
LQIINFYSKVSEESKQGGHMAQRRLGADLRFQPKGSISPKKPSRQYFNFKLGNIRLPGLLLALFIFNEVIISARIAEYSINVENPILAAQAEINAEESCPTLEEVLAELRKTGKNNGNTTWPLNLKSDDLKVKDGNMADIIEKCKETALLENEVEARAKKALTMNEEDKAKENNTLALQNQQIVQKNGQIDAKLTVRRGGEEKFFYPPLTALYPGVLIHLLIRFGIPPFFLAYLYTKNPMLFNKIGLNTFKFILKIFNKI